MEKLFKLIKFVPFAMSLFFLTSISSYGAEELQWQKWRIGFGVELRDTENGVQLIQHLPSSLTIRKGIEVAVENFEQQKIYVKSVGGKIVKNKEELYKEVQFMALAFPLNEIKVERTKDGIFSETTWDPYIEVTYDRESYYRVDGMEPVVSSVLKANLKYKSFRKKIKTIEAGDTVAILNKDDTLDFQLGVNNLSFVTSLPFDPATKPYVEEDLIKTGKKFKIMDKIINDTQRVLVYSDWDSSTSFAKQMGDLWNLSLNTGLEISKSELRASEDALKEKYGPNWTEVIAKKYLKN